MWAYITELLLGLFVIGWLLLYWQHALEIRQLQKDYHELAEELADTTGRVVNVSAAMEVLLEQKKRNGKTA